MWLLQPVLLLLFEALGREEWIRPVLPFPYNLLQSLLSVHQQISLHHLVSDPFYGNLWIGAALLSILLLLFLTFALLTSLVLYCFRNASGIVVNTNVNQNNNKEIVQEALGSNLVDGVVDSGTGQINNLVCRQETAYSFRQQRLHSPKDRPVENTNRTQVLTYIRNLPKYDGLKNANTALGWLTEVEAPVLANIVDIQDIYDALPMLLTGAARSWFLLC